MSELAIEDDGCTRVVRFKNVSNRVALALSIPEGPFKAPILAATYAVVLFSIIVQGLTLGRVIRRTVPGAGKAVAVPEQAG